MPRKVENNYINGVRFPQYIVNSVANSTSSSITPNQKMCLRYMEIRDIRNFIYISYISFASFSAPTKGAMSASWYRFIPITTALFLRSNGLSLTVTPPLLFKSFHSLIWRNDLSKTRRSTCVKDCNKWPRLCNNSKLNGEEPKCWS